MEKAGGTLTKVGRKMAQREGLLEGGGKLALLTVPVCEIKEI